MRIASITRASTSAYPDDCSMTAAEINPSGMYREANLDGQREPLVAHPPGDYRLDAEDESPPAARLRRSPDDVVALAGPAAACSAVPVPPLPLVPPDPVAAPPPPPERRAPLPAPPLARALSSLPRSSGPFVEPAGPGTSTPVPLRCAALAPAPDDDEVPLPLPCRTGATAGPVEGAGTEGIPFAAPVVPPASRNAEPLDGAGLGRLRARRRDDETSGGCARSRGRHGGSSRRHTRLSCCRTCARAAGRRGGPAPQACRVLQVDRHGRQHRGAARAQTQGKSNEKRPVHREGRGQAHQDAPPVHHLPVVARRVAHRLMPSDVLSRNPGAI